MPPILLKNAKVTVNERGMIMQLTLLSLVLAAALSFPIGHAWGRAKVATLTIDTTQRAAKARKYPGPAVTMRWGPVQVTIAVKGRKITNVLATAPSDRSRSAFINSQALPLLRQEVLQAQSANVATITGATMTSKAYIQSLKLAVRKARL